MLKEKVIKKFILTFKSEQQKKYYNVYTFYVDPASNKFQIRNALESLFNVKVERIATSCKKPTLKNPKRNIYTKLKKKAFVKLKQGYKIGDEASKNENFASIETLSQIKE
jgi:large subunit ribosomal protein L23